MALDLYFAGAQLGTEELLVELGCPRLLSQLNDRPTIRRFQEYKDKGCEFKLFIDSGAYSAHTKGRIINVDEYIEYLNTNTHYFDIFAQLDTIPGEFRKPKTLQQLKEAPELSWQNYLYMRERIIDKDKLLPIFHQGEDFKHLKRILEWTDENGKHIPYIGISPANDVATKYKEPWLHQVFTVIKQSSNPNVKTHAFGMTSKKLLCIFPFTSADSTTWIQVAIFGCVIFEENESLLISNRKTDDPSHYSNLPKPVYDRFMAKVEERGFNIEDLESIGRERCKWNAIELMEWVKKHEIKGKKRQVKRLF